MRAAQASGLDFTVKRIAIAPGHEAIKPAVTASLAHVDGAASDSLTPPWPDVVLAIGRHLSCVALWIKAQSGGQTRIALLNAPKGRAADFDLVVLPPFYRGPGGANSLRIGMPLIGIDPAILAAARTQSRAALAGMPRPLHVLLVGGDMGQRKLRPGFAASLLHGLQTGPAAQGSIHVATSRRTPAAVADALAAALRPQDRLYRWDGSAATDNPYLGLLAHGDVFTVTADSLSMIIEVARLGKPLLIAEPPREGGLAGLGAWISDRLRPRDLGKAIALLRASGHAGRPGETPKPPTTPLPDDAATVGAALRRLAVPKVERR